MMSERNKLVAISATPKTQTRQSSAKSNSTPRSVSPNTKAKKPIAKSAGLRGKVIKKSSTKNNAVKKSTTTARSAKQAPVIKKPKLTDKANAKLIAKKTAESSKIVATEMAAKAPTKLKVANIKKPAKAKSILYLGHATRWNFKEHLYTPLRESHFSEEFHLILPHELSLEPINTKSIIENCNVMLAEVSYPSTGLGIELGWAEVFDVPIIAFYQEGRSPTTALKLIAHDVFSYDSMPSLIEQLSIRLHSR